MHRKIFLLVNDCTNVQNKNKTKIKQTVKHMAKNDDAWTRSPSRIKLKIIFLQNSQFFMNYAKGPVKIHWLLVGG